MEDEFEFEERMAKRAMLVEKAIRYAIGLARPLAAATRLSRCAPSGNLIASRQANVLAAVVAFFCRIAANKADSSASDQWMQTIENIRREAAKREAR